MTDDLKSMRDRVADWLSTQGYPLEMSTAEAFRRVGFSVAQSHYFADTEEGVPREIDVIATAYEVKDVSDIQLTVVAECKKSSDKPWVSFTSAHTINERGAVYFRTASESGQAFLKIAARDKIVRELSAFRLPSRLGYGLTQAFTSGKDVPFEAVMGAAKAGARQLQAFKENWDRVDAVALVVMPVVVTEAPLFESYLNVDGELELEEVSKFTLIWRHPGVGRPLTLIDVVRASELARYANAMQEAVSVLANQELALEASRESWRRRHEAH